jgi:hypothetical protein
MSRLYNFDTLKLLSLSKVALLFNGLSLCSEDIDVLTALVKRSGDDFWKAYGLGKVYLLNGVPDQQLQDGK